MPDEDEQQVKKDRTKSWLESGAGQGAIGGAGGGTALGAGLGTVTGAIVGTAGSAVTGTVGGAVGAGVGAIHGPFMKLKGGEGEKGDGNNKISDGATNVGAITSDRTMLPSERAAKATGGKPRNPPKKLQTRSNKPDAPAKDDSSTAKEVSKTDAKPTKGTTAKKG